jgi:PHD/YefM family antitoxin component YafN of YafNO toxin-antitoxin module
MLIDTENIVTKDEFRKGLDKYLAAARRGAGPVAVIDGSKVVAVFISSKEYQALLDDRMTDATSSQAEVTDRLAKRFGKRRVPRLTADAVSRLLESREGGPTLSHEEVRAALKEKMNRARK